MSQLMARVCLVCLLLSICTSLQAAIGLNAIVYREAGFAAYGAERWNLDSGQKLFEYDESESFETVDAISMGPDGRLYAAGNSVGHITIIRFDVTTGASIDPPFDDFDTFIGGPVNDMAHGPDGRLYTAATDFEPGPSQGGAVIRRFDGATGNLAGQVSLGANSLISAMQFSADGQFVHVLHRKSAALPGDPTGRVSTYPLATLFAPLPPGMTPIESTGFFVGDNVWDMAVGPDGLFYLSDFTADAVLRYSPGGLFIDEFVDELAVDLQFIDGRLLALSRTVFFPQALPNRVLEIDTSTGEVTTLIDAALIAGPQPIQFLGLAPFVVPEPAGLSLTLLAGTAIFFRRRNAISRRRISQAAN
jgi:hypothetical protein